ncbi:MAG: hypothetical protein IMZ53_04920, partial [Thermoplasmata archaeon]|nr:hypothetical protein [Thermoplasmata archaeon]
MTLSYKQILGTVGYPTDVLVLDFESYFDSEYHMGKDAKALSTIEYIMDPRFELTGLGCLFADTTLFKTFYTPIEVPDVLSRVNWATKTVVVQDAFFDITVLKEKFGIVPKYIIDVKDLAKHYDAKMSAKLKDLAKLFRLQDKGDTQEFKGMHWVTMTPVQRESLIKYCSNDIDLEWELFQKLLPMLTNAETELKLARHTLDLYLNPVIKFDSVKAKELSNKMFLAMIEATRSVGHTGKVLRSNKFIKLLEEALPEGELVPMKLGKNKNIPALAKEDEGLKYLLAHPDEKVHNLVLARQAVKSWPLHIKRIENMSKQSAVSGGRFRVPLGYYSAHTGRWGGNEKVNPQNFGGKGRAGKGTNALISQTRELLGAPDGYKFTIIDSAQIEARVLAWLAGQEDLLNGFANGEDIYSVFATRLFGCEVRKPQASDNGAARKILEVRRGFGKDAILGCVALGTPILTDKGWKPIENVTTSDILWDGKTWVLHDGVTFRGKKRCVEIN